MITGERDQAIVVIFTQFAQFFQIMVRTKTDSGKGRKYQDDTVCDNVENSLESGKQPDNDDDVIVDDDGTKRHEPTASTSAQDREKVGGTTEENVGDSLTNNGGLAQGTGLGIDPDFQMWMQQMAFMQQMALFNQFKSPMNDQLAEAPDLWVGAEGDLNEEVDSVLKDGKLADILRGLKEKYDDIDKKGPGI